MTVPMPPQHPSDQPADQSASNPTPPVPPAGAPAPDPAAAPPSMWTPPSWESPQWTPQQWTPQQWAQPQWAQQQAAPQWTPDWGPTTTSTITPPPAPAAGPPRSHPARWAALGAGVVAAGLAVAVGIASSAGTTIAGFGSQSTVTTNDNTGSGDNSGSGQSADPWGTNGGSGSGSGTGSGSGSSGSSTGTATAAQAAGIVYITTVLGYEGAQAAGTGMILSSDGEVLTNNHVVEGATKITVTVASTGKSYTADVVGTSPTQDVAVIQLDGASGLTKAAIDTKSDVTVGEAVTGVGNAGGLSQLNAATGAVTALDQTITASDESGTDAETLSGLIETSAPIQAGDSGGPLYDADGKIIGMDTAAETDSRTGSTSVSYAITIKSAVAIAEQIESGQETDTIHIGYPAFLGVQIATTSTRPGSESSAGALVGGVVDGTPAASAGLAAGDTITAIDSTTITSAADVSAAMQKHNPGDSVSISWTDSSGQSHTQKVTLIQGPAD